MIKDYYLSKAKDYTDIELAKEKATILNSIMNENKNKYNDFYPNPKDLQNLPENSLLIKISFILKKPYLSKDEGEFHNIDEKFLFSWRDKKKLTKYLKTVGINVDEQDINIEENKISFSKGEIIKENGFAYLKIGDIKQWFLIKEMDGEIKVHSFKIFENPIVRDKFTGLPIVKPSTWKGHLRFSAERVVKIDGKEIDREKRKKIIRQLFGSEPENENALKGRLYFFPTFFEDYAEKDVITPLDRRTRAPVKDKAPIPLEVMKPGSKGDFYLLYVPYPKGKDFKEEQIEEDLKFLAEALELMFYTYGFSAKKTSGFGVIEELKKADVHVYPENKGDIFLILYTKLNKNVKDSVSK